MNASQKAFIFLIELQEWELAGIFIKNMNTDGLKPIIVNAIKLINDMPILKCDPEWLLEIDCISIFNFGKFTNRKGVDKLTKTCIWKLIDKKYTEHFF
jgi:hypothetical protein